MLIDAYPAAAAEKDSAGNLPLHNAVSNGACVEVVDMLLKAHPEAAREKNKGQESPLHVVYKMTKPSTLHVASFRKTVPSGVVQMLIDAYPAAAAEKDSAGNLPLHYAVWNGACVEVVDMLLKAHPEAARECEMYIQCQRDYSEERKRKREFIGISCHPPPISLKTLSSDSPGVDITALSNHNRIFEELQDKSRNVCVGGAQGGFGAAAAAAISFRAPSAALAPFTFPKPFDFEHAQTCTGDVGGIFTDPPKWETVVRREVSALLPPQPSALEPHQLHCQRSLFQNRSSKTSHATCAWAFGGGG